MKFSGISRTDGTTIFGDKYLVDVTLEGFKIKKSHGINPIFFFPVIDIILGLLYIFRQNIQEFLLYIKSLFPVTKIHIPQIPGFLIYILENVYVQWITIILAYGIVIYVFYNLMKKIRYWHGCEHKVIASAENNDLDNIKKYSTISDRCGGTYLFSILSLYFLWILIIKYPIGLFTSTFVLMMFESKYFHKYNIIGLKTGRWIQKFTTKEPGDKMLEMGERSMETLMIKERNEVKDE